MNPDQFEQAQQLFLHAIGLPDRQRSEYIKQHAEDEAVRDEALSLLGHHVQATLLPEATLADFKMDGDSVPRALDGTVEFQPEQTAQMRSVPAVTKAMAKGQEPIRKAGAAHAMTIGKMGVGVAADVSERFAQSTNQLLRNRLIVSTFVLSGMLVIVSVIAALSNEIVPIRLAVRGVTLSLLGACCWVLIKSFNLSRRWLRTLEILIVAIPLVELTLIQWFESNELLAEGNAIQIEELRAIVFTAASIYIAVYGMFIPSNWRRTALVTSAIAVLPLVVSVTHQTVYQYPPDVEWMHFVNPTLAVIMAFVATVGAGVVHRVRREAEEARYYGQYQLIKEIGRGGMGIVYLGKHQLLKRPAAIKLIRGDAAGSPQAIQQFEKEVQATATLSHWNTVQIYDYGTTDAGDFYCVMEYLKGETLQQRLNHVHQLSLSKTMDLTIQLCNGLEEAHQNGMVHRDIKPANVYLAEVGGFSDVVKLLDFGLVITKEESAGDESHVVGGTPAYMSPEQIRGEPLDGRSDIYAIGCLLYECLTGEQLFAGYPISKIVSDHLFRKPNLNAVSKIDPDLAAMLERCLAKDRKDRFASVVELRAACAEFQG